MSEGASVKLTANGVVLTSGKPIRCWGYRMQSSASGPGLITFYDGTDATGTQRFQASGTANGNTSSTFGNGILFTKGMFVTLDANTTYVDVDVQQHAST